MTGGPRSLGMTEWGGVRSNWRGRRRRIRAVSYVLTNRGPTSGEWRRGTARDQARCGGGARGFRGDGEGRLAASAHEGGAVEDGAWREGAATGASIARRHRDEPVHARR